jgi:hypothetical protein
MRTRSRDWLISEAARVLSEVRPHVWDGRSLPVPIDAIAEDHFGLLVREVGDIAERLGTDAPSGEGDRISGALIVEKAEIWVDLQEAAELPRRRRYTIAHELGHWVLHRGPESAFCREAAITPAETVLEDERMGPPVHHPREQPEGAPRPGVEWEANVFGGALLMPPWLLREVWERTGSVEGLAEAFDCSISAVGPRWQHHYDFARRDPGPGDG